MSCMSAILVNLPGVTDSNLEQRFFSFLFFSFIFAEDDSQPLGISILQQTAVSFLAVPQMA